jgi:hypothetical protein
MIASDVSNKDSTTAPHVYLAVQLADPFVPFARPARSGYALLHLPPPHIFL